MAGKLLSHIANTILEGEAALWRLEGEIFRNAREEIPRPAEHYMKKLAAGLKRIGQFCSPCAPLQRPGEEGRQQKTAPEAARSVVTIFDWDDTLFPTSFIMASRNKQEPDLDSLQQCLRALEPMAAAAFLQARRRGAAFVVTNAKTSWVHDSAVHLPSLAWMLEGVEVISARTCKEAECPFSDEWKSLVFRDLALRKCFDDVTDIIVVGDGHAELAGASRLRRMLPDAHIKAVQFRRQPSPEELSAQLRKLREDFEDIVGLRESALLRLDSRRTRQGLKTHLVQLPLATA